MLLVDRKIDQYVDSVAAKVPMWDRKRVREELTDLIHEMLADYAGTKKPDILDCKDVLRDLGTPDEVARMYLESGRDRNGNPVKAPLGWEQSRRILSFAFSAVAALLVIIGVVGLGTQSYQATIPLFLGVVLSLISIVSRSVRQTMNEHQRKREF